MRRSKYKTVYSAKTKNFQGRSKIISKYKPRSQNLPFSELESKFKERNSVFLSLVVLKEKRNPKHKDKMFEVKLGEAVILKDK